MTSDHLPAGRLRDHLYTHLEGVDKRPMGVKHCKGLSDRLAVRTSSEGETSQSTLFCRTEPTNSGGGTGTPKQRSNRRDSQPLERVLLKPLPGPKKGRRAETRDKPEGSEPICSDATLQDGGNPYFEGSDKSKVDGKSRSEGCLLCNPNPPVSSAFYTIPF